MPNELDADWARVSSLGFDWDASYKTGAWDHLSGPGHIAKNGVVAGFLHHFASGGRILDAGCGEGALAAYLDFSRFEYIGFDCSPTAVGRARSQFKNAIFVRADLDTYSPPDREGFDAIVFNDSLGNSDSPFSILDHYLKFLKPNGILVISLFQNPDSHADGPRLIRLLAKACDAGRYNLYERADAVSVTHSFIWRIFVIRAARSGGTLPDGGSAERSSGPTDEDAARSW